MTGGKREFRSKGVNWPCLSPKDMKEKYQNKTYAVIGEIGAKAIKGRTVDIPVGQKILKAAPAGTYRTMLYRTYGYIEVEKDTYLAVKKSNINYILLTACIVLALFIGILWNTQGNVPLDPNSQDYKGKLQRPENWDANSILIPGFDDLHMNADSDTIYVAFSNPKENPCYFQYTIVLDKTEEIIYTSGLIEPGKAVVKETLNKPFPEGVYPITIKIRSYSLEDYEKELNGGAVQTNLVSLKE